jgi:alpha-galactosidase
MFFNGKACMGYRATLLFLFRAIRLQSPCFQNWKLTDDHAFLRIFQSICQEGATKGDPKAGRLRVLNCHKLNKGLFMDRRESILAFSDQGLWMPQSLLVMKTYREIKHMRPSMKNLYIGMLFLLSLIAVCHGELLVYEPFDYQPHNHEVQGRLEGRHGGLGFSAPWADTTTETGYAFVYDQRGNPEDLYDGAWGGGQLNWDGIVENLPTMGGYIGSSDWNDAGDALHSTRKLAQSAGAMAKANNGVLWLSAVWHIPAQQFFAPVGIALASDGSGFKERAVAMNGKANAIGVGNGRHFRERKDLNPIIWQLGEEAAGEAGKDVDGQKDNIIILKFEFGETDTVSTWSFTEDEKMSEDVFNQHAVSCNGSIDEDSLEYLAIATILRGNAVDEIRLGTSFDSVLTGTIPPRQDVNIVKRLYDAKNDTYTVEWTSNPGEAYGLYLADDAGGYKPCVAADVQAAKDKRVTTFGPFANPDQGNPNLQFEMALPDSTPPTVEWFWGNGSTISILFSEPMIPTTALSPDHYTITHDSGHRVDVSSVAYDRSNGTIMLTTKEPLKPRALYTITTRDLADLANHSLVEKTMTLRTWDDDPKGIKVFILAGQSNMVGYGHKEGGHGGPGGPGSLRYLAVHNEDYPEYDYRSLLINPAQPETSDWKTRPDVKVWWRNGASGNLGGPVGKGDLGPPFRGANPKWFGPEYGFGQVLGDYYDSSDVLIIKAAWGGRKLVNNFRSPYAVAARGGNLGPFYKGLFEDVREVLYHLDTEFPEWAGRGYQIVGIAWHQGTSDKSPDMPANEYKYNLPDLIRSLRAEFGKPDLPFVIATTGMSNVGPAEPYPYKGYHPVERAQLWAAGVDKPAHVLSDDTRPYWEEAEQSPANQGFHWNHNARSYFRVGYGLGNNMVKLLDQISK